MIPKTLDDIHNWGWRFDTARYSILFWAEEEELNPTDGLQFPEDIEFASSGRDGAWFCAVVAIYKDGALLNWDTLGGCSYNSVREFYTSHWSHAAYARNTLANKARHVSYCHYFPDMVRTVLSAARAAEIRNTMTAS